MLKRLLGAASVATLCLVSSASAQETINMWVRTGIGKAFTSLAEAYNASHENQIALTEVPFAELVQKYATAIAGGQAPDALSLDLIYTPAFAAASSKARRVVEPVSRKMRGWLANSAIDTVSRPLHT